MEYYFLLYERALLDASSRVGERSQALGLSALRAPLPAPPVATLPVPLERAIDVDLFFDASLTLYLLASSSLMVASCYLRGSWYFTDSGRRSVKSMRV